MPAPTTSIGCWSRPWPRPVALARQRAGQRAGGHALPAAHIPLVENERCLHLLPWPLAGTIHPGRGRNLAWLAAPWLQARRVAHWGDIDTWGLAMLEGRADHLPHLQALLMGPGHAGGAPDRARPSRSRHQNLAPAPRWHRSWLDAYLRGLARGRLNRVSEPPAWRRR